jgi:hypothetical protein
MRLRPLWVKLSCSEVCVVCPLVQQLETSNGTADRSHSCQELTWRGDGLCCHLGQAGLSIAIDEPVWGRQIAEWPGFDPIAESGSPPQRHFSATDLYPAKNGCGGPCMLAT